MMATRRGIRPPAIDFWVVALSIVFLAALAVRLYGIDWDDGADLHPDELFITQFVLSNRIFLDWPPDVGRLLDPARSGLNPRSVDPATGEFREFAYGALPLWVTDASAWILSRLTGTDWNSTERAYLVGRALSAVLSALTILPIAALGAAVGGRSVGLLAALFAALAPMSIQLAHFFTTDSWLAFFVAICLLASVTAARTGKPARFAVAGGAFGLAMATKGSVFALAAPIVVALAIDANRRFAQDSPCGALRDALVRSAVTGIAAAASFFAFEPYALLRPDVYLHSLRVQADIASSAFDVPFTRVYTGTAPFVYQLEQFVRWGYGPVAAMLSIAGIVLLAILALRHRSPPALIVISWLAAYGGVILLSDVKFMRYLEPLAPVFAVAAAVALTRLSTMSRPSWPRMPRLAIPLIAMIVTLAWTGAFLSIYAHENTRLAASRWIYGTIPPGSTLTAEYWDDALPRSLAYAFSPATFGFATVTLDLYRDLPPQEASDAIYNGISQTDFVIQSSERVEAAMLAAPWRYPVQGRYFAQLEQGVLGFERTATFARPPSIGSVPIDDRSADESFINYDHPRVSIYERNAPPSRSDYDAAMSWALQRPWFPARAPPEPTLLLDGPVGENPSVNDGRWSAAATSATPVALALWILLLLALLAIGRPIARWLLPTFPDQGWGLARLFALVVAAYAVWLGASLEIFRFRAVWVIVALLLLGLIGWRYGGVGERRFSLGRDRPGRGAWMHAEAAFWLVFLLFLAFRLANPDGWHPIWGGEKPMEFAQINAIQRGAFFPPYDPWFADGYVNYYYYGFYLMAFLFKATGIPSEIGFNLALPTVMGLLASGGFSVAAALARGLTRSPRLAVLAGWLSAIALTLLGNLTAIRGLFAGGPDGSDPFLYWTWSGSRAIDFAITEFPYFSGLYADLHAHVVALPLTMATVALCLAVAASQLFARPIVRSALVADVARLAMLALLLGSLSATNAWDVPVYAALAVASVFMATVNVASRGRRLTVFVLASLLMAAGAWLLFVPFHRHFVALFGQVALVRDPTDLVQFLSHLGGLLAICAVGLTVLFLHRGSRIAGAHVWPWLALATGLLGILSLRTATETLHILGSVLLVAALAGPPLVAAWLGATGEHAIGARDLWLTRGVIVVASAIALGSVVNGRAVFGLTFALGSVAALGWVRLGRGAERFVCLLLAAGLFTAAGVELVVVADDLIGGPWYRMNTVFKFYNQIWVLLALAGSALIAVLIRESARRLSSRARESRSVAGRQAWARFGLGITTIVILASLAYPALATGPQLALRFTPGTPSGSLNALGWMEAGAVPVLGDAELSEIDYAGDASAIEWFFANVAGTPVIAEASIGPYRCNGSRISSATGLPTIIGWERHEQQQRYPDTLPSRVTDVRTLYTSDDPEEKTAILRRYNVEYVVVGDLERLYPISNNECSPTGSAAGIAAFDAMLGTSLEVAHTAGGTTIFRVLPIGAT